MTGLESWPLTWRRIRDANWSNALCNFMRVIIGCYFGTFVRTGVFDYLNVTEREPRYSPHHHLKMENYIILYCIDGLIIYTYFLFFSFFITRCSNPLTCASTNFKDHKHTIHQQYILIFLVGISFKNCTSIGYFIDIWSPHISHLSIRFIFSFVVLVRISSNWWCESLITWTWRP